MVKQALQVVWCAALRLSEYYPIDFRIYAKEADGKSKNDHFQEMLLRAVGDKQIQAKTVLFDSWYGSWRNLSAALTTRANRMVRKIGTTNGLSMASLSSSKLLSK